MPPPESDTGPAKSYVHLRWKAAYASGNPVIDQEHQALFQSANTLLDQLALRSQQPQAFGAAFEALLVHVTEHFAHEETILQAHGFADLAAHAQQHRRYWRAHARCIWPRRRGMQRTPPRVNWSNFW